MNDKQAQRVIALLGRYFDSHAFIRKYMEKYPKAYAEIVSNHKTLKAAHATIGKFLLDNSATLNITKLGEIESLNVLMKPSSNALWLNYNNL